jgi:hypothetical protein
MSRLLVCTVTIYLATSEEQLTTLACTYINTMETSRFFLLVITSTDTYVTAFINVGIMHREIITSVRMGIINEMVSFLPKMVLDA